MTVKLIDEAGSIVRTVFNVRGIEQPESPHPNSWWLLMEFSDKRIPVGKQFKLLIETSEE